MLLGSLVPAVYPGSPLHYTFAAVAHPGGMGCRTPTPLKPNPFEVKCPNCASAVQAVISKQL